jgi:hypothetical protein
VIHVTGIGAWAPGHPDVASLRSGSRVEDATEPPCKVADARAKRGASRLARMLGEVVEQAAKDAGADLATIPTVYASAWGEIDIMIALLEQIHVGETGLSPLRFKHSVHNSASGLVSIAASNKSFSTAIAGGRRSFEQGMLESLALLRSGAARSVIFAVAEDRLPRPLDRYSDHEALALAFCFDVDGAERAHGAIAFPERVERATPADEPDAHYAKNPTAWGLPLLRALFADASQTVELSAGPRPWAVGVEPRARRA